MTSTDLIRVEPGGYLALSEDPGEIQAIIEENLGGQEITEFDLPRVKVPAGGGTVWEVPSLGGTVPEKVLSGIIVHFKLTRAYWPHGSGTGTVPACRSDNSIIGIGTPGGHCKTCPMAEYGTALDDAGNEADGQACNAKELLFMLRPGSFLPIVVALPATSLKAAKQYRVGQLGSAGMRLPSVVTDISLVTDRNAKGDNYSKAVLSVGGILAPEEVARATEYARALRPIFDAAAEAINAEAVAEPVPDASGDGQPPTTVPPAPAAAADDDEPAVAA